MNVFLKKEVFFVKFPIIFPLIYGIILFSFPSFETQLIFITILLMAETHFGATWPFFINKINYNYINEKKNIFNFSSNYFNNFLYYWFFLFSKFIFVNIFCSKRLPCYKAKLRCNESLYKKFC